MELTREEGLGNPSSAEPETDLENPNSETSFPNKLTSANKYTFKVTVLKAKSVCHGEKCPLFKRGTPNSKGGGAKPHPSY